MAFLVAAGALLLASPALVLGAAVFLATLPATIPVGAAYDAWTGGPWPALRLLMWAGGALITEALGSLAVIGLLLARPVLGRDRFLGAMHGLQARSRGGVSCRLAGSLAAFD